MAPRGARVLDVGCGQGRMGVYLHARGHRVTGVDIDPYLVDRAREQCPDATWEVADLAVVRRRQHVPVAADESIRRAEDPLRVVRAGGADRAVVKVAPLGGPRRLLAVAAELGVPLATVVIGPGREVTDLYYDWAKLRDEVKAHGMYNRNLQAVPPTGSISYINNSTSSIHPVASKIEIRKEGKIGRVYYPAPYLTNVNLY